MKERTLVIDPFEFISFKAFRMYKKVGEHGTVFVQGVIPMDKAEIYKQPAYAQKKVRILSYDENKNEECWFNGLINKLFISDIGNTKILTLEILSHTYLSDITKHTRTFQNVNMTFDQLNEIVAGKNSSILSPEYGRKPIGSLLVQYEETDWEYEKRIASVLNTVIVPNHILDSSTFSLGMVSEQQSALFETEEYIVGFDNATRLKSEKYGVAQDTTFYEASSRNSYELCTKAQLAGETLYVYEVNSVLDGGHVKHNYILRRKEGFRQPTYHNKNLIGSTLTGNILKIEKDMVQIDVHNDVKQSAYMWFTYATVYSSPNKTGWYFMPEVGDEARLQFPTEEEKEAYVLSAVHLGEREDADTKSIRTKWGKEVVFTPTSILINNGAGSTILLDDSDGIAMNSTKDIKLKAGDSLTLNANGKVTITGNGGVTLNQTSNQINIEETIDISAGHVRIR